MRMFWTPFRLLLPCALIAAAGCGGGGSTSGAVPVSQQAAITTAAAPGSATASTQSLGNYYAGTVSGVGNNTVTINCGQSNFSQGYGCMTLNYGGASVTGTPVAGQYFQMWGPVTPPVMTATSVVFGPSPFPSSAPATGAATPTPGPGPSGGYFAGIVSGVGSNAVTIDCGQHNFSQGYGCMNLAYAGATVTGTPVVGQYFQMWGAVTPPYMTATTVNFGPAPYPSSTPAPGTPAAPAPTHTSAAAPASTPLPAPTPAPIVATAGIPALSNGQAYATSWVPFGPNGPWNSRVSANPTMLANSSAIIASEFANGNSKPVRSQEPGIYDYNYGIVYAQASDPVVNLSCNGGRYPNGLCLGASNWGTLPATIHIPANARVPGAGSGGDCVLAIVQPPPGLQEIDTAYGCNQGGSWTNGATFSVGSAANCGSFAGTNGESGWLGNGTGATAGGNCVSAGLLHASELIAGHINHALKLYLECQGPGNQYPAFPGAATDLCPNANGGPPMGARLWYDVPDATTNAAVAAGTLKAWEGAILNALHDYGGYFDDNSCPQGDGTGHCAVNASGVGFAAESEQAIFDFGQSNPWAQIPGWSAIQLSGNGVQGDGKRWVGADPWQPAGVNFVAHLHWLAVCSAQNQC